MSAWSLIRLYGLTTVAFFAIDVVWIGLFIFVYVF